MNKKINRLLLATAVCASSAYSGDEATADDETITTYMEDRINDLRGPTIALKKAIEAIDARKARREAMQQLGELLQGMGVDMSPLSKSDNTVEKMQKIAQETTDQLDGILKAHDQQSNTNDQQSNTNDQQSNTNDQQSNTNDQQNSQNNPFRNQSSATGSGIKKRRGGKNY